MKIYIVQGVDAHDTCNLKAFLCKEKATEYMLSNDEQLEDWVYTVISEMDVIE